MSLPTRSYWCFLSYRHADNKEAGQQWASWLHQAIETYEVPEDLVGTVNGRGDEIPERIFPVFRDEEELPADADLSSPIGRALDASKTLVVLCSPRAVQSRYVAEEILLFKQGGKSDRIMAALLDGEPNASRDETKSAEECFPKPLMHPVGEDGQLLEEEWTEPIAADFRLSDGSEGWTSPAAYRESLNRAGKMERGQVDHAVEQYAKQLELGKLKIIAGILGVPLGTLTKRDKVYQLEKAKRKARVFRVVAAVMAVLAVAAVVAGIFAGIKEREAQHQRKQAEAAAEAEKIARDDAEGLVRFLTDEQGLGRDFRDYLPLRLQEQIKAEVEAYFTRRREREELEPSEETWAFLFQLANMQWASGDVLGAKENFLESAKVAEELGVKEVGVSDRWRHLAGRSLGWMGEMLKLDTADIDGSEKAVREAMGHYEVLREKEPESAEWKEGIAMNKTRLADVYLTRGDFDTAEELYREAVAMRRELMEADQDNPVRVQRFAVALNRIGELFLSRERFDDSYEAFVLCRAVSEHLLKLEPDNRRWLTDLGGVLFAWRDSCRAREDWERSLTLNEELMVVQKKLLEGDGERIEPYYNLSMSQRAHAEVLAMLSERWSEEVEWLRKSEETLVEGYAKDSANVYVGYQVGGAANWLASVLVEREEGREEAMACLDRAKAMWLGMEGDGNSLADFFHDVLGKIWA